MRWRRDARRAGIRVGRMRAVGLLAASLISLAGCAAPGSPGTSVGPHFVTPPLIHYTSVLWPVPLQLVGAEPGSRLRLVATMPTPQGEWSSGATYTVPASGVLDLASARPQLAAFSRPDSAGLFWSLQGPRLGIAQQIGLWAHSVAGVTIDAWQGARIVASRLFRLDGLGLASRPSAVFASDLVGAAKSAGDRAPQLAASDPLSFGTRADATVGDFYSASSPERPRTPAVLVFDDDSMGASSDFIAPLLVEFGASVLVLPSGGAATGAQTVSVIDASAVSAALDWLASRPDIDRRDIFFYGTGQAEQFALWSAVRYRDRVAGAFGAGGSTTLLCLPDGNVSAAFEGGVGVPCQADAGVVRQAAVFALNEVRGPLVLGCGGRDEVLFNACRWLDAAVSARGARAGDSIVRASAAAHPISVPPGLPIDLGDPATAEATEQARIAFWNAVARILLTAATS